MEIAILGPGCQNCVTLERLVTEAVDALGLDATVTKVTDYADIAASGVASTPGLVIDGEVVSAGRVPTAAQVRQLVAAARA